MSVIMGNQKFYASHSLLLQIEHYIHKNDLMDVQRCILKQMGSSLISKEVIMSVKKMKQKKIDCLGKTTTFMKFFCLFLLGLLPICFDVGTDSALLVQYSKNHSNSTQLDRVSQGRISFKHSKFKLDLFHPFQLKVQLVCLSILFRHFYCQYCLCHRHFCTLITNYS